MALAEDYGDVPRTTAVPTFDEMVRCAQEHPEMWARQLARQAQNIEHARSQPGFDPVVLSQMVEHHELAKAAVK